MKIKYSLYEFDSSLVDIVICKPDEETIEYYNRLNLSNITKVMLLRHVLSTTLFRYTVSVFCSNISTIIKKQKEFCSLVSLSNGYINHTMNSQLIEDMFRTQNAQTKYDVENFLKDSFMSINITSNTTIVQLNSKMKDGGIGNDFISYLHKILKQNEHIPYLYGGAGVLINQNDNSISNALSIAVASEDDSIIEKLNNQIQSLSKEITNAKDLVSILNGSIQHIFTDSFEYNLSYILNK